MATKANLERSCKGNPEAMKWPTDKARYDKNYTQIFGMPCIQCNFYEKDYVNNDGDWVKGRGCYLPVNCPYNRFAIRNSIL